MEKLGVSVHFLSDTGCRCHLRLLKLLDSCVRSKWGETELARPATIPRARAAETEQKPISYQFL